ncbi:glycine--tRNA ligase subunit beta [Aliiglaciecola sp. CAU 1673]|uniref:glycine--tRNA ligase subunit beta n=1 Tax=Aliiglaciecola sp. CAU 1673 TaxID=3032595 RepID=UPI0023DACBE3|nr:glycine--tRNA ligase subunit beta [Aliiglaciecola sp. CAU 1673]MDF2179736.1 glycine--tRNA ligase subunit beta [Aliiglaciecola sp. CAU 1673]
MRQENLLIEIGTEELPPKSLTRLAQAFAEEMQKRLDHAQLAHQGVSWLASPRRLAVKVSALAFQQPDREVEKRGPAVASSFDAQGNPTKAALGWARGAGIEVEQAQRLTTDKGEWLVHKALSKGASLDTLLPGMVNESLAALPIPKPMRWGSRRTEFIRPVHTATLLYGSEVMAGEVLGVKVSNTILGHRFHSQGAQILAHADSYEQTLEQAYVVADFSKRREIIARQLQDIATELDAIVEPDPDLLDEVTALVEWPVVLTAKFEESFLQVPKEALIYTMKGDQKYFPLQSKEGKLLPTFAFVTNIESKDPEQIIKGNEKVIRPRLADAQFFFSTDRKSGLASRIDSLDTVLFQQQLGTLKDKSVRLSELSAFVAEALGESGELASRAGLLAKADLMTQMVMEFPDVQGVMGMHYALADGEDPAVANALNEQYMPRFSGDTLPASGISCAVAIADKLDTLVGIFGVGQSPKGDKDPFALRRAAIGLVRIMVEKKLNLDLVSLIEKALELLQGRLTNPETAEQVLEFVLGRFRAWYQEQGIEVDVIQAVLARRPTRPADFDARVKAVQHFRSLEAAGALAAANKRVANILAKAEFSEDAKVDEQLLKEQAEIALWQQLYRVRDEVEALVSQFNYREALVLLSALRESVDSFFDHVMVMDEDMSVRNNRLALLQTLRNLFLKVADISILN